MSEDNLVERLAAAQLVLGGLSLVTGESVTSVAVFLRHPLKRDSFGGWRWLDLADDLRKDVREACVSYVNNLGEKRAESLEFDVVTEDVLGYVPSEQFYEFSDGLESLPFSTPGEAMLGVGKANIEGTRAVGIAMETSSGRRISLFQSVGRGFLLNRKLLGILEGSQNKLISASEKVIQIPETFSMLEVDGCVFVINEKRFSKISSFDKYVHESAAEAFQTLKDDPFIELENEAEFKNALLSSSEFMRRLASAHKAGALKDRNIERMHDDIQSHRFDIRSRLENGKIYLHADMSSRKARRDIVDVLADKVAFSNSSGLGYLVHKGAPLKPRGTS